MSFELTCSQSSSLIAQNTIEKKIKKEKTIGGTGSGCEQAQAMSYELICSQSSSLIAQITIDKKKLIRKKPL
jgi:hypothetical protein